MSHHKVQKIKRKLAPFMRLLLAVACMGLLASCGGDTSSPSQQVAGKIIDGYIRGATVFWDCNRNFVADASEVKTISQSGGSYTIEKVEGNCFLTAEIPVGAVDESDSTTIKTGYTMMAMSGQDDLITPMTTLVQGQIFSGKTKEESVALVSGLVPNNNNVLADYMANSDKIVQSLAKGTANYFAQNNTVNPVFLSTEGYQYVQRLAANPATLEASNWNILSNSYGNILSGFLEDAQDRSVKATDSRLNDIATLINDKKLLTENGIVNWSKLEYQDLKMTFDQVVKLNLPINQSRLSVIKSRRDERRLKLAVYFDNIKNSESRFSRDFQSNYNLLAGLLFDGVAYYGDIVQARTGLPLTKVNQIKGWYKSGKIPVNTINLMVKLSQAPFEDVKDCADFSVSFLQIIQGDKDTEAFDPTPISACVNLLATLQKDLQSTTQIATGVYKAFDIPSEEYHTVKGKAKLVGLIAMSIKGILQLSASSGPLMQAAAGADMISRFSAAFVRSCEYDEQVAKEGKRATDAAIQAANTAFVEHIWFPFYVEYLGLFDEYFQSSNSSPSVSITATPSTVRVGEAITFAANVTSTPNGTIKSYAWKFGDGGTSSSATQSYTYSTANTYTVELTVTDANGITATATQSVTINPANPTPMVTGISSPLAKAGVNSQFVISGTNLPTNEDLTVNVYSSDIGCSSFGYDSVNRSSTQHNFACTPTAGGTLRFSVSTAGGTSLGIWAVTISPAFYTPGQAVIDLGTYGKLISPYQFNSRWYYVWDTDSNSSHTWEDASSSTTNYFPGFSGFLKYDANFQTQTTSGVVDESYRYGYINNVKVGLPKIAELQAINIALNGGMPSGWLWGIWASGINYANSVYWSATGGAGTHSSLVKGFQGTEVYPLNDTCCRNWAAPFVALEVLAP